MPKITAEEAKEFAIMPADSILHLKIEDCEVKTVTGRNGDWEKLEFTFKVLDIQATGDGSSKESYESVIGSKIWGSVPFKLTDHPENKLRMWTEAILKVEVGVGFDLDTDLFLRREVRGLTTLYDKKAIDPKTNKPFQNHQIASLLPAGGGAPAQQQPGGFSFSSPPQPAQQPTSWAGTQQPAQPAAANGGWATPGQDSWSDEPPF